VNKPISELSNPLMRVLMAAALSPGLRSISIFDATSQTLESAAENLQAMLHAVTGDRVESVWLNAIQTEEDLWGRVTLDNGQAMWKAGSLTRGRGEELRLAIIPDLSQLSMATARACVALMGSEIAHLERHGKQERWRPNLCWLAACPSQNGEVGLVSPHLLDRFALRASERIPHSSKDKNKRIEELQRSIQAENDGSNPTPVVPSLSPESIKLLDRAKQIQPTIDSNSIDRVFEYFDGSDRYYSTRRDLALLRLAVVNARLEGVSTVQPAHVDLAAGTIGVRLTAKYEENKPLPEPSEDNETEPPTDTETSSPTTDSSASPSASMKSTANKTDERRDTPGTQDNFTGQDLLLGSDAYREDATPNQREAASLRLPFHRLRDVGKGRGTIIGVEPATNLEDLAIVGTLFEAAKYQQTEVYQYLKSGTNRLVLTPKDLRQNVRTIVPEQMLTMAIDYTCLQNSDWKAALLPYLQWAYMERASVCLIQIGAATHPDRELRAERVKAKHMLVPEIRQKLEAAGGRATPLAHGLNLALQTLRHEIQHGQNNLEQVVFVVITDGRGNIPLEASLGGKLEYPVGRQGIDDALEVAGQIAKLKKVKSVVLNPEPSYYSQLPVELAIALGGKIKEIQPSRGGGIDFK
jgi:magnesium chelatase subunit D